MRNEKVLVVYKSVTGFTKHYAKMIEQEIACTLIDSKNVTAEIMSNFHIVIFGGRLHAGTVDGLKHVKELFEQSKASQFIVYATGAMPNVKNIIDEMWNNNLSSAELKEIPHFYMQGGLCYERMPFADKMMMKVFCTMLKKKKNKNEFEELAVKTMSSSYDHTSKEYIMPLLAVLKSGKAVNDEEI